MHVRLLIVLGGLLAATAVAQAQSRSSQLAPSEGYVTSPDGVRLFYRVAGTGDPVVLLPGAVSLFDDFKRLAVGRTLIAYDQRNRGRSDAVSENARLQRGVLQDADDMETMRQHFKVDQIAVMGHSYVGLVAALYAINHPDHVSRVVQIGPAQPDQSKRYPADLAYADATTREVFMQLGRLQQEAQADDPEQRCERAWVILRPLYVADPKDANKLSHWGARSAQ